MNRKILLLLMVFLILSISVSAQENLTKNKFIDPFKDKSEQITTKENDTLGQIEVEVTSKEITKENFKEILNFKGILEYQGYKAVILRVDGKTKILTKNDRFNYNKEEYQLLLVENEFILLNRQSFERYTLIKQNDIGGVQYSVKIKE